MMIIFSEVHWRSVRLWQYYRRWYFWKNELFLSNFYNLLGKNKLSININNIPSVSRISLKLFSVFF